MAEQRLIMAIGQLERALSRIERADIPNHDDNDLITRHENLKSETRLAIKEIDQLLNQGSN